MAQFWDKYPDGAIRTDLASPASSFTEVVFRAEIYKHRDHEKPDSVGYAAEKPGNGANQTSWHENCETSAIGRALANMGAAKSRKDRPSKQEMQKVERAQPEMVSIPDAGGGFRRVPADSPAAAHAAIQDAAQLARQQAPERMAEEAIGQPIQNVADATMQHMTERQRSFIWAMTRERGMTEEMVKAQVREFYGKEFSEMLRRDASAYIERLKSVDIVPGVPPVGEPHPAVQTAMDNNTANWIASMEGAGNMVELSRLANEATAAKAMNDYVRAAFNKQRDRLQEKALV